jgi:hypothetical protein
MTRFFDHTKDKGVPEERYLVAVLDDAQRWRSVCVVRNRKLAKVLATKVASDRLPGTTAVIDLRRAF